MCNAVHIQLSPRDEDINLKVIETYQKTFRGAVIGYSGHEKGIAISQEQ